MAVRKTVTVLFADVAGSTELAEALDPEAMRRLMSRWFDDARTILERHGATVEKFIGDAVMAVFGIPAAHEDDALRAVRAAAELRDSVDAVQLRIGVNTGEVAAGDGETLVTGDTVNVAARLQQTAKPGEILIGETTRRLVPAAVELAPVEALSMKGKSELVPAHRLVAVGPDAEAFDRRLDAPLVGRERELADLRHAYDRAIGSSGCELVTILGEPGIGKSRLARELVGTVTTDARVLAGRCLPYGDGITYWPLVELTRELELAGVEVGEAVRIATGAADGTATSEEIFLSVRRLFETLAREQPLVVVLDDLQWAEPIFLDLVEHMAYLARSAPILLVGLARPELLALRPGWPGTHVRLGTLSDAEAQQLMRQLGGEATAQVITAAGGNPLFIEQMLALGDEGAVPPTVQALIAARLDRLAESTRQAIELASIAGEEFWSSAVRRLAGEDIDVGHALLELVREGFVRLAESTVLPGEDTYRFAHILVRDAAYDAIAKESRARLHRVFAEWVDQRDAERGLRHDEIVAYHLEQALRLGSEVGIADEALAEEAGARLFSAGTRAFARHDVDAASNLLARARQLLPSTDTRRLQASEALGVALFGGGRFEAATTLLEETIAEARSAGDEAFAERVTLRRDVFALVGGKSTTVATRAAAERAIRVFERAGDEAGLALAWSVYGDTRLVEHRILAASRAYERSLGYARNAGDAALETQVLAQLARCLVTGPTPVDEALGQLETLTAERSTRPGLLARFLGSSANLLAMRGDHAQARERVSQAIALREELGQAVMAAAARGVRGYIERLARDDEAAERCWRESCLELQAMGERAFLSTSAGELAHTLYRLGRYDEAEDWTDLSESVRPPSDADSLWHIHSVRAKVKARRGRLAEAQGLAREVVELVEGSDAYARARVLADAGEVLALSGERTEAEALFERAKTIFEQKGAVSELALLERQRRELRAELAAEQPLESH